MNLILAVAMVVYLAIGISVASLLIFTKSGRQSIQEAMPINGNASSFVRVYVLITFAWVIFLAGVSISATISKKGDE